MEPQTIPTLENVKEFLTAYGWHFREISPNINETALLSNYRLENSTNGVLLSFRIADEFLLVSTVDLLKEVPDQFTKQLLGLNDKIKLVKIFTVDESDKTVDAEIGFELWAESFNKHTFFAFMNMLIFAIENVLKVIAENKVPHVTNFVKYT